MTNPVIQQIILNKVNTRKCITARQLILELGAHNIFWSKKEITDNIMELSSTSQIVEIELLYSTNANESIFLPKGTVVRYDQK